MRALFTAVASLAAPACVEAGLMDGLKNLMPGNAVPVDMKAPQVAEQQQAMVVNADGSMSPEQQGVPDVDLACLSGPQAQIWFNIQQKFRYILPAEAAFTLVSTKEIMEPVMFSILEDLGQISQPNQDACGVGKLMIQLLSILVADDAGVQVGLHLEQNEPLTSPILTLLLDIPWQNYDGMWPVKGMLAQLSMRRVHVAQNDPAVDGLLSGELQQFAQAMDFGIVNADLEGLKALSAAYLETGAEGVQESPLAYITALFCQAATAGSAEEAQELYFVAQNVMKRMVFNPADLDTTLKTRWPLWGMAYLAAMRATEV